MSFKRSFGVFPIIDNFVSRRRWVVQRMRSNVGLWDISKAYMLTFDLVVFKVILGSFGAIDVSNWPVTRQWLVIEKNGLKFRTQGDEEIQIWFTFDLVVSKVILRSFGALVPKFPETRKRQVVEQNRVKSGTWRP